MNTKNNVEMMMSKDGIQRVSPSLPTPKEAVAKVKVARKAEQVYLFKPEPEHEIYTLRDKTKIITAGTDLNVIILTCNRYPRAYVINSKGDVIHESTHPDIKYAVKVFITNSKITLTDKPLYVGVASNNIKRKCTGVFYVAHEKLINGRYLIKETKNGEIIGYVNSEDID